MRILSFFLTLRLVVGIYTAQAVDEDALLLYLPFDDGAGKSPKDASGNENKATIQGNLKWVNGWRTPTRPTFWESHDNMGTH